VRDDRSFAINFSATRCSAINQARKYKGPSHH
jgi:hypothetical protein